jgi:ubiquinone/menaquinone biosynthesis C-methylase UbiE
MSTTIGFDKYEKFGAYHWKWYLKKPRYTAHVDRIKNWITEKNVLDIGAGDGLITFHIGGRGVDNNKRSVELALSKGVDVIEGSAYELPFKDEEFESAYIGDTLEHLEFPEKAILEARRVITKYLYMSGPLPEKSVLEAYEYEASKWNKQQLKENVEKLGFVVEGEIEQIGRTGRAWFYVKYKKV